MPATTLVKPNILKSFELFAEMNEQKKDLNRVGEVRKRCADARGGRRKAGAKRGEGERSRLLTTLWQRVLRWVRGC